MEGWIRGTVVENKRWNHRLCSLRVVAELPDFIPGQFMRLALEVDGELIARPYSLVSPPGAELAEFYFNKVDEGPLSPRLHSLEAGDTIWLSQMIAGFLTLPEMPDGKNLWMLSTGTALGPFLSILQEGAVWDRFEKVVLVHGVRSVDELTYLNKIDAIKQQAGERFIPISSVTREQLSVGLQERIPDAISSGKLEQLAGIELTPEHDRVMLCGNPGMVEGCLETLAERGLVRHRRREPGQILMEVYK